MASRAMRSMHGCGAIAASFAAVAACLAAGVTSGKAAGARLAGKPAMTGRATAAPGVARAFRW